MRTWKETWGSMATYAVAIPSSHYSLGLIDLSQVYVSWFCFAQSTILS